MKGRGPLVAIITLIVLAVASGWLILRTTASAIDANASAQADEAPVIARTYIAQFGSLERAAPTIVAHISRPGLRVILHVSSSGAVFGEHGISRRHGTRGGNPLTGAPPPGFRRPNRPGVFISILLGMGVRQVPIPGGEVTIFPAAETLEALARDVLSALAIIFALGFTALWYYTRGVRREALRPLRETTRSLRRLAERDFSPRTIVAGEGTAYDELARAFNAAVEAVAAAFAERRAAESEMQRFIADAGHELRTPLTILNGYLDIIDRGGLADPEIAHRIIGGMRLEAGRMRKLVEKLIVLARMETPSDVEQRASVDVVSLVARTIESLEPLAMKPIEVDGIPVAQVYADEDDLAEAFGNVIENALKYAPDSAIRVRIRRDGGDVVVAISDRGPGMSPEDARNAFERFFRGERRGEVSGSGLGLAIAKRAVERAQGTIALASEVGAGVTVSIRLPALASAPPETVALVGP